MTSNAAPTIIALTLLTLGSSACEAGPHDWRDDYTFVWHGEHVSVYGFDREPEDAFAGSMQFTDAYAGAMAEYLGYGPGAAVEYRWMSSDSFPGKCPSDAGACASEGEVISRTLPDMHELAHGVVYNSVGPCPALLSEGLAEYFARPRLEHRSNYQTITLEGEIEDMFTNAPVRFAEYERAGHFVAFLVESYGVGAVLELCKAVPRYDPVNHWEHAVESVIGTSFEALLKSYAEYPLCTLQQYRARLMECSGEIDIIIDPYENTDFSIVMDEDQDDVIGPIDGKMVAIRRVWVEEFTYALVTLRTRAGDIPRNAMASQQCVPCSAEPRVNDSIDPNLTFVLPEGRHAFFFYRHADRSDIFDVTIIPQHGWGS